MEKKNIFTGEKPGRYHPNPGTKLNRRPDVLCPLPELPRKAQHHCCAPLAPNAQSQSNWEETSEKPKVERPSMKELV